MCCVFILHYLSFIGFYFSGNVSKFIALFTVSFRYTFYNELILRGIYFILLQPVMLIYLCNFIKRFLIVYSCIYTGI